jgi:hypothetical protein
MIEFVSFAVFILLFFILIIKNISIKLKLVLTSKELIQAYVDKNILAEKLFEISTIELLKKETDPEAFLKFISDSRDWAYKYIEDLQSELNKFINNIEPEIAYFDEYGVASSAYPHYHSMKKISGAYKELKKMLPEDYGKIDK